MKEKACLVIKGMTEHNYLHTRRRSQSIVKFSICQKKKMEKKKPSDYFLDGHHENENCSLQGRQKLKESGSNRP